MEQSQSILAIGKAWESSRKSETEALTECDRWEFDLQVMLTEPAYLDLFFRTSDVGFEPCQRIRVVHNFSNTQNPTLTHLAVSLRDGLQEVYANGVLLGHSFQSFSNDLQHWDTNNTLYLLSYPGCTPFDGALFQFDILATALTATNLSELMRKGVEDSPPFAVGQSVTVNEDAEGTAGSHTHVWHKGLPSQHQNVFEQGQGGNIRLEVGSVPLEANNLLQSIGLAHSKTTITAYRYITRLPLIGAIILPDGQRFDTASTSNLVEITTSETILYLPPHNQHSNHTMDGNLQRFASLDYCVTDYPILYPHECTSAAVEIYVAPVNDPPIPTSFKDHPIIAWEGQLSSKILLSGTNVEKDDFLSYVEIVSAPRYGNLSMSVSSFRSDRIRHGTLLQELDNIVSAKDDVYVQYHFDPSLFPGTIRSFVKDSFIFRVADSSIEWSRNETVTIDIHSALNVKAVGTTMAIVPDGSKGYSFRLEIHDTSGFERAVGIYVERVPLEREGMLIDTVTNRVLTNGTRIISNDALIDLVFQPSPDLCGGEMQKHLVAFRAGAIGFFQEKIVSVSELQEHQLVTRCEPGYIYWKEDFPPVRLSVIQSDPRRSSVDPCTGNHFLSSNISQQNTYGNCTKVLIVRGINISSETPLKWVPKMLRVEVHSDRGFLTFNGDHWNKTLPIHGRRIESRGTISFFTWAHDLSDVFFSLVYRSDINGVDTIDLRLYQEGNTSTHTDQIQIEIEVVPNGDIGRFNDALAMDFPWQILVALLGYPLIYYIVVRCESFVASWDYTLSELESGDDALPEWIQHETEYGDFYYEHVHTGQVTWMAPVGRPFIRWEDIECTS